jgi:hypothetical protein
VIATQQFDDDLWFVNAAVADDQSAVAQRLVVGSAADGQQSDPRLQSVDTLLTQAAAHVEQTVWRRVCVFAEQFAILFAVVFIAQIEPQTVRCHRVGHRSGKPSSCLRLSAAAQ